MTQEEGLIFAPKDRSVNLGGEIIRDPKAFSSLSDEYADIKKFLLGSLVMGATNIYSQVSEEDRAEVLEEIDKLFRDVGYGPSGGFQIHLEAYRQFAVREGFVRDTPYGKAIVYLQDLDVAQRAVWEAYLDSVDFIENQRMMTAKGINALLFPAVSVKYREQNIPLAVALEEAKRSITRRLIPNISDEEARIALGQRYTAEIARTTTSPEWFF